MSSSKLNLGGRPKTSGVWEYFKFNIDTGFSQCVVQVDSKTCGRKFSGRNPTNLKSHLASFHKEVYAEFDAKEKALKSEREAKAPSHSRRSLSTSSSSNSCSIKNFLMQPTTYAKESDQHKTRARGLAKFIAESGISTLLPTTDAFKDFCKLLDPKFALPGRSSIEKELEQLYEETKEKVKESIANMGRVTVCLDMWTKKGMTASFLGISVCGFDTQKKTVGHMMLNLHTVPHPHTGDMIGKNVEETLRAWGIKMNKVLCVVTDNGSNMIKAFRRYFADAADREELDSSDHSDDDEDSNDEIEVQMKLTRLPCFAHTIQLVVITCTKSEALAPILTAARRLVEKFRKSSVATQSLIQKTKKSVINDCPTRWSSTYLMINRLLETGMKSAIIEVADEMGWDCLQKSEWAILEQVKQLLQPFAEHTRLLEGDAVALSSVIPAILDLDCHLLQFQSLPNVDQTLKNYALNLVSTLRDRFACILNPELQSFQPLPAIACLLDPVTAPVIMTPSRCQLLQAAKQGLLTMVEETHVNDSSTSTPSSTITTAGPEPAVEQESIHPPPLKRFKFLAQQLPKMPTSALVSPANTATEELSDYTNNMPYSTDDGIQWWLERSGPTKRLPSLALDILSAPSSEAFVERMFSACGDFTTGKRNRTLQSLERKVFIKLNRKLMPK